MTGTTDQAGEPQGADRTEPKRTLVGVDEARQLFHGEISRRTFYRLIEDGDIPHHRVRNRILVDPADVDSYRERSRRIGTSREPAADIDDLAHQSVDPLPS